jgi:F420-0:gamma-glutamyl ligase-like protein
LKIKVIKIKASYWLPGTDYIEEISRSVEKILIDGDIVTVSEKALSTALGNIIDESLTQPGFIAKILAKYWMRRLWGGPLGKYAKLRKYTIDRLKKYPFPEGAAHKQVALENVGLLQALRHYSEGGIDASNLPFSYVSLPLDDPQFIADSIRKSLEKKGKKITTIIVDGDTTYTKGNLHLAPRKVPVEGLIHAGGFLTFLIGRNREFKARSTPLAISGTNHNPDFVITLANISHRVRGHGAGMTVWDMAEKLGVGITDVTWEMLNMVDHYPIAILRIIN